MITYKEFFTEGKKQKKPNPYAAGHVDKSKFRYIKYPASHTVHIGDWETVKTDHGDERGARTASGELPGGHIDFMKKVIKDVENRQNPRNGEFYYRSMKHDQGAIIYVHHSPKQMRVKTILPKGNHTLYGVGDKEIRIESVENYPEIETVILYDTEFDENFDLFLRENFDMTLQDVV